MGQRFGPADGIDLENTENNVNVTRKMEKLSALFNPEANKVFDTERNDDESVHVANLQTVVEDLEFADEGVKFGKNAANIAISQLFGDLAFVCRDSFLQEPKLLCLLI